MSRTQSRSVQGARAEKPFVDRPTGPNRIAGFEQECGGELCGLGDLDQRAGGAAGMFGRVVTDVRGGGDPHPELLGVSRGWG